MLIFHRHWGYFLRRFCSKYDSICFHSTIKFFHQVYQTSGEGLTRGRGGEVFLTPTQGKNSAEIFLCTLPNLSVNLSPHKEK